MNEIEKNSIQNLLKELNSKPPFRIITCVPDQKEIMETIENNIHENKYASVFDFTIDIRMLFYQCRKYYKQKSSEILIIEELSQWFEKKINNIPHTLEEYKKKVIAHHIKAVSKIEAAISLTSRNLKNELRNKNPPDPHCYEYIQQAICGVTSIEEMREIIQILKKHGVMIQPGAVISIPYDTLPSQCIDDLAQYLNV